MTRKDTVNLSLATTKMDGGDWRKCLVLYEEIILPAIPNSPHRNAVQQCLETLNQIQWISYSHLDLQSKPVRVDYYLSMTFILGDSIVASCSMF
jgi:hypothetical protein